MGPAAFLLFILLGSFTITPLLADSRKGTTEGIKDIFIGRCITLQLLDPEWQEDPLNRRIDCRALWDAFAKAVAYKPKCKSKEKDFDEYFQMIAKKAKALKDTALFWSGTYSVVRQLTFFDDDFTALEDTLPGYLINQLHFCGSPTGFANSSCPTRKMCPNTHALTNYWSYASEQFAKRAQGITYVLVNGTRTDQPAYSRTSFFGGRELPHLNTTTVTELRVLVISDIKKRKRETCRTKSIKLLVEDSRKRGIKTSCTEDPRVVLNILCLKYPKASECIELRKPKAWVAVALGIILAVTWCLFTAVIVVLCIKLRKLQNGKEDTLELPGNIHA